MCVCGKFGISLFAPISSFDLHVSHHRPGIIRGFRNWFLVWFAQVFLRRASLVSGGVKTDVNRQSEIPKNSWNRFCFTTGFRADQRSVVAFSTKNGRRKKVFHESLEENELRSWEFQTARNHPISFRRWHLSIRLRIYAPNGRVWWRIIADFFLSVADSWNPHMTLARSQNQFVRPDFLVRPPRLSLRNLSPKKAHIRTSSGLSWSNASGWFCFTAEARNVRLASACSDAYWGFNLSCSTAIFNLCEALSKMPAALWFIMFFVLFAFWIS